MCLHQIRLKCCASSRERRRRKIQEAFSGSKIFYSELEKIVYAVVMAARKLRHYVEGHITRVITNQPLNNLFANKEAYT
jgi:hypothetical protein